MKTKGHGTQEFIDKTGKKYLQEKLYKERFRKEM